MRIAEIIGTVTLARAHPSLTGARWLIGVPFSLKGLREGVPDGEELVMYDHFGAGLGSRVGFAEAGEAAAPFLPEKKPVDAYCACLLDRVVIHQ
jgi:ethanolamine utilization protein EutN